MSVDLCRTIGPLLSQRSAKAQPGGISTSYHLREILLNIQSSLTLCSFLLAEKECLHVINPKVVYVAPEHTDIVKSIICHESRVYSIGYVHLISDQLKVWQNIHGRKIFGCKSAPYFDDFYVRSSCITHQKVGYIMNSCHICYTKIILNVCKHASHPVAHIVKPIFWRLRR